MIDKGKYASHGAFIKRLSKSALVHWDKPKLAIIHPVPSAKPREPATNDQLGGLSVQSKTFSAKFRFQDNVEKKPVSQQFSQPFLYIEKVVRKQTLAQKLDANKKYEPFVTTVNPKRKGKKNDTAVSRTAPQPPPGFASLYDFEEERRRVATRVFEKLLEADVHSLKDMFVLWAGKSRKASPDIEVREKEFVEFFKEILPNRLSEKQLRRFFELYRERLPAGKEKEEQLRVLSIKALSFNYEKYRKAQTEVANIMSEKALKERYMTLKDYSADFDAHYPQLKQAMNSIRDYEESLKRHFRALFTSYADPSEDEIAKLRRELEKPIIKYDKFKKQELLGRIQQLSAKDAEQRQQLGQHFGRFMESYEEAVRTNHDLFFTKRTANKLLLPLLQQHPLLTRALVEAQVEQEQQKKERYLECLSDLLVEIDRDKKHLGEDCFTLDEVVQLILMRGKKGKAKGGQEGEDESQEFLLYSAKKLMKEVKKQFLLKHQLSVQQFQEFPADQEIGLQLLHTCFEMECTKVLFKNQIWSQLLQLLPEQCPQSNYHQRTIDANTCLEFLLRYFRKLDSRIALEMNKSKQISLLAENVSLNDFQACATIIEGVLANLDSYVEEEEEEEADKVQPLEPNNNRRVTFADVADLAISKNNFPEQFKAEEAKKDQEMQVVRSLIRSIFEQDSSSNPHSQKDKQKEKEKEKEAKTSQPQHLQSVFANQPVGGEGIHEMQTLAKSFFVPEGLNTNSFDIRYYEKERAREQRRQGEAEVVRLGSSALLSNLPNVEQIKSDDPLRISRFLMGSIEKGVQEERRVVREQAVDSSIKEGVSHNYYRDKIRLENKPTRYDSEGRSKYSVLLPVGYYEGFVAAENAPDEEKWYLRPHHVETLTENPLSKKDNVLHTQYHSRLDKLPPKRRPDENIIEENVRRKEELIAGLEERIGALKGELAGAQRGCRVEGAKVPPAVVDRYLSKLTEDKEDRELEIASYEGVLYDLRRKERELLVAYRQQESQVVGEPEEKWWERKDKLFNNQLRKDRLLQADALRPEPTHKQYVEKLKNNEIY